MMRRGPNILLAQSSRNILSPYIKLCQPLDPNAATARERERGSGIGELREEDLFNALSLHVRVDLSSDVVVNYERALGLHQQHSQLPEQRAGAPPRR